MKLSRQNYLFLEVKNCKLGVDNFAKLVYNINII